MKDTAEQNRNGFLDFQKAILIFCVVWTHCATSFEAGVILWKDNYLNVTVTTFQMQLFILISGYLFYSSLQKYGVTVNVLKKTLEIAFPAVLWNFGAFVVSRLANGEALAFDFATLRAAAAAALGSLWYLWVLYFITVIVCIASKLKKEYLKIIFFVIIEAISHFVPVNTYYFGAMFPFFLIGYYCNYLMKKYPDIEKGRIRHFIYALAIMYPVLRLLYRPEYSMYIAGVLFDTSNAAYLAYAYFIRFICALSGCAAVWTVCRLVFSYLRNRKAHSINWLCKVGKYTMPIYIMHMYMIDGIYALSAKLGIGAWLSDNLFLLNFVISPVAAVLLICISIAIYRLLTATPVLKYAFGIPLKRLKPDLLIRSGANAN